MKITSDDTVHARSVHVLVEWNDLKALLVSHVASRTKMNSGSVTSTVSFQQRTEGSPEYRIAEWEACVQLVQDLRPRPAPEKK